MLLVGCFIFDFHMPSFNQSSLFNYYKSYSVLGPFFTDKSVRSTYLLGVERNDQESYYPQLSSHQEYLSKFSYQQLKRADFEKLLSWYSLSFDKLPAFRIYLLSYLYQQQPALKDIDSISIIILNRYGEYPEVNTDTLKIFQYP